MFPLQNIYSWKLFRNLKWQISGESLAARYRAADRRLRNTIRLLLFIVCYIMNTSCFSQPSVISWTHFIPLCRLLTGFLEQTLSPFKQMFLEWTFTLKFMTDGFETPVTEASKRSTWLKMYQKCSATMLRTLFFFQPINRLTSDDLLRFYTILLWISIYSVFSLSV